MQKHCVFWEAYTAFGGGLEEGSTLGPLACLYCFVKDFIPLLDFFFFFSKCW